MHLDGYRGKEGRREFAVIGGGGVGWSARGAARSKEEPTDKSPAVNSRIDFAVKELLVSCQHKVQTGVDCMPLLEDKIEP